MSVQAENFTIQQGETFSKDFILKNPDNSLVGISSYTSTGFLAKYAGDSTTYPFTVVLLQVPPQYASHLQVPLLQH
jgi:hypothetical protein